VSIYSKLSKSAHELNVDDPIRRQSTLPLLQGRLESWLFALRLKMPTGLSHRHSLASEARGGDDIREQCSPIIRSPSELRRRRMRKTKATAQLVRAGWPPLGGHTGPKARQRKVAMLGLEFIVRNGLFGTTGPEGAIAIRVYKKVSFQSCSGARTALRLLRPRARGGAGLFERRSECALLR
jgi:hypothetical protein